MTGPSVNQSADRVIYLFGHATWAGSPQQPEPITVGPYYLSHPVNFPCGRKSEYPLTILFSHVDRVRVHIKIHLTGDRTRTLRGERRVVWPLHHRSPKHVVFSTVILNFGRPLKKKTFGRPLKKKADLKGFLCTVDCSWWLLP